MHLCQSHACLCQCVCVYTDGPCSTYPSQDNMLSTSTYISNITDEIRHLIRFCDEVTRPSRESSTLLVKPCIRISIIAVYSVTCLLWTPWDQPKVSRLSRCPDFPGQFT